MPTAAEWLDALIEPKVLWISSDSTLKQEVSDAQAKANNNRAQQGKSPHVFKPVTPEQRFDPGRYVSVCPIQILLSISKVTSTPVSNLADISSTWAVLRYIWAFKAGGQRTLSGRPILCLSAEAKKIDFHQKTLLSDQVGTGLAGFIMESEYGLCNSIDISLALNSLTWNLVRNSRRSPDYIFFNEAINQKAVVECKGNQTSYSETISQLCSASEQLTSVSFSQGPQPLSLMMASQLSESGVNVYVLDPPSAPFSKGPQPHGKPKAIRDGKKWLVEDMDRFNSDLAKLVAAKKLSFSGLMGDALSALHLNVPNEIREKTSNSVMTTTKETSRGVYVGSKEILYSHDGARLEVFRGIRNELHQLLTKKRDEETPSQSLIPLANLNLGPHEQVFLTKGKLGGEAEAHSIGGEVLCIKVRKKGSLVK